MKVNTDSVCNWIKSSRNTSKKTKLYKSITIQLFKENDKQVSAKLNVEYNKNTQHIVFTHGLYYLGNLYHPNIYINKLKCINKHTIEQYKKCLNYNKNVKSMLISFKLEKYMYLYTRIVYNFENENIRIRDEIHYKSIYIKTGIYKK